MWARSNSNLWTNFNEKTRNLEAIDRNFNCNRDFNPFGIYEQHFMDLDQFFNVLMGLYKAMSNKSVHMRYEKEAIFNNKTIAQYWGINCV